MLETIPSVEICLSVTDADLNKFICIVVSVLKGIAGGNQRELARERNLKKQQKANKGNQDTTKLDSRMERDADIMRKKQEAAAAKKAAEEAAKVESSKKLQNEMESTDKIFQFKLIVEWSVHYEKLWHLLTLSVTNGFDLWDYLIILVLRGPYKYE
ncbi:unnamed protein product [Dracunculus medinensis]|uniref:4F5 domain-containing protein n=1 Tax=Dracunculus medinensis TaxID=318479 RepID=A0A0N4UP87_DRAME|nr:unnamed protein product [Dracunculus medinensis]